MNKLSLCQSSGERFVDTARSALDVVNVSGLSKAPQRFLADWRQGQSDASVKALVPKCQGKIDC